MSDKDMIGGLKPAEQARLNKVVVDAGGGNPVKVLQKCSVCGEVFEPTPHLHKKCPECRANPKAKPWLAEQATPKLEAKSAKTTPPIEVDGIKVSYGVDPATIRTAPNKWLTFLKSFIASNETNALFECEDVKQAHNLASRIRDTAKRYDIAVKVSSSSGKTLVERRDTSA